MIDPLLALSIAAGLALLAAVLFWPEAGLYWRWQRLRRLTERVLVEDALKHLYHCQTRSVPATLDSLSGALSVARNDAAALTARLEALELVEPDAQGWRLTDEGRRDALRLVRAHRLWEKYLAENTGLAETRWHDEAHRLEHQVSPEQAEAMAAALGQPLYDPHGAPIPTAEGELPPVDVELLTALNVGDVAMVTRVEDEPEALYAQLLAQRIVVGARLRVLERTPQRIRLEVDGDEQVLAVALAREVAVRKAPVEAPLPAHAGRLADLRVGQQATVVGLSPACRGLQRRRLLDLGLVPGTIVAAELRSVGGDPTAYRIRGALVALRAIQAEQIQVIDVNNGV